MRRNHDPLEATGTLSGLTYVRRLETWRKAGYRVEIVFLRLKSTQLALRRVCGKVGMTCLGKMSYGGTPGAGRTFNLSIDLGGLLGYL